MTTFQPGQTVWWISPETESYHVAAFGRIDPNEDIFPTEALARAALKAELQAKRDAAREEVKRIEGLVKGL